jgi:hypothetical protein
LFWGFAFLVGLNFTHLDEGPMKKLELNPEIMKTWGLPMWIFFIVLMLLIAAIFVEVLRVYIAIGILKYYLAWGGFLFGTIIWNTKRNAKLNKHIHIHHYTLA